MMASPNDQEARIAIVDSATIVAPPSNTTTGSSRRPNEKAPLLTQRRLFRSLGGFTNGLSAPFNFNGNESSGGYTEFGSSVGSINGIDGDVPMPSSTQRTLGTFSGVFCPVALSMFSALLFLRVGFIVGNSGLFESLVQFCIAYGILLFTVLSICAISTNGAVEGGGAYFMISRTLGPEFGGAIGALFIFANLVSSALYVTGCVEGLVDNLGRGGSLISEGSDGLPNTRWYRFLYCSVLNFVNLIVCLAGSSYFAKTSAAILAIVGISLTSVVASFFQGPIVVKLPEGNDIAIHHDNITEANFTGFSVSTFNDNLYSNYTRDYTSPNGDIVNFAVVFGVLFSGVTGIMAGANMSGELKNPGKSIPKGTLSAVGFTFLIYVLLSFLTASTCSNYLLHNDYIFMMGINLWPPLVSIGILTATFSASLSNLIGASRVLEAVAKDEIFGVLLRFVANGTTRSGNPIVAVLVSFVMVEMFLLIGSLNVIAQLNSVLFLLSYCAMNLACLGLELTSAPNFRPAFKYFSAHTAFIGMIGTLVMMFAINAIYACLSIIACLMLVMCLHLLTPTQNENWGSISQALIFHQVRKYLLLLDSRKEHVKFWRPHMLLFVANPRSACPLIDFVNDMKKSGLYVLGHVLQGDFNQMETDPASDTYSHWLALVDHLKVKAFIELTVSKSIREGMQHLIRICGLGAMRPNTIVFGFHDDTAPVDFFGVASDGPRQYKTDKFRDVFGLRHAQEERFTSTEYVELIKDVIKMKKNLCLCRNMHLLDKQKISRSKHLFIDAWPINFFSGDVNSFMESTSLFLLQIACILNMTSTWKGLTLRVFLLSTSATTSVDSASREAELRKLLQVFRIKARIVVVPWDNVLSVQLPNGFPEEKPNAIEANPQWPLKNIRPDYIRSVNTMVKENSANTAVNFLYLPEPPMNSAEYSLYFNHLSCLSEGIGPCVLVHGISPVTSTTL